MSASHYNIIYQSSSPPSIANVDIFMTNQLSWWCIRDIIIVIARLRLPAPAVNDTSHTPWTLTTSVSAKAQLRRTHFINLSISFGLTLSAVGYCINFRQKWCLNNPLTTTINSSSGAMIKESHDTNVEEVQLFIYLLFLWQRSSKTSFQRLFWISRIRNFIQIKLELFNGKAVISSSEVTF